MLHKLPGCMRNQSPASGNSDGGDCGLQPPSWSFCERLPVCCCQPHCGLRVQVRAVIPLRRLDTLVAEDVQVRRRGTASMCTNTDEACANVISYAAHGDGMTGAQG
jgi:hypothetical protein